MGQKEESVKVIFGVGWLALIVTVQLTNVLQDSESKN